MGNKIHNNNEPILQTFNLNKLNKINLNNICDQGQGLQVFEVTLDNCFLFLSFRNNRNIYKFNINQQDISPVVYPFHQYQVKFMSLTDDDSLLIAADENTIRIHYTEILQEKVLLENYKDRDEKISYMTLFNSKYLAVLIQNQFQIDIFDLDLETKESVMGPIQSDPKKQQTFNSFLYNQIKNEFYLLSQNWLFIFRYQNQKYRFSHQKYIRGKDRSIFHLSYDGSKLFTLKAKKVCVRETQVMEKLMNFQLDKKYDYNSYSKILNDDRILIICDLNTYDLKIFDLYKFKQLEEMNLDYVDLIKVTRDNNMFYITNKKSIFMFEIYRVFEPPILRKFIGRKSKEFKTKKLNKKQDEENKEVLQQVKLWIKKKDYQQAMLLLRNQEQNVGRTKHSVFLLAKILNIIKKFKEAEQIAHESTIMMPNNPHAWFQLGVAQLNQNKFEQAKQTLEKSVELDPQMKKAFTNLEIVKDIIKQQNQNEMQQPKSDIEYPSMSLKKIQQQNQIIEDEEIDFLEYEQKVNYQQLDLSQYKSNLRNSTKDCTVYPEFNLEEVQLQEIQEIQINQQQKQFNQFIQKIIMIKQLKNYILFFIFFKYYIQACQKNCILCDTNDVCLFCDVTKSFLLIDGKCQYSVVDFCELLNIKGVCLGCKKNYFLDPSTLKCVQIDPKSLIENCYYYQTAVSCKTCNTQYYLTGGVCKEVPTPISGCLYYSNESGTFCEQCDTNFILAQDKKSCLGKTQADKCQTFNMAQCKICKSGYLIEYNKYLDQIFSITSQQESQFLMNYVLEVSQLHDYGICQKIQVDNCAEVESLKKCKICNGGYYLDENGICILNPEDGVPNCQIFESNTNCLQCKDGYYLKSSQQCLKAKEILFCSKVSPTANYELCIQCKDGYYLLSENECKQRKQIIFNCQILDPKTEQCEICMDNFYLSENKLQCFADIQNCLVHKENDSNNGLICQLCADGYYFVSQTSKCIEGKTSMNCAQFETPEKCKICKNGYIFNNDNICIAHETLSSCSVYSQLEKNGCQTCENSYMLFQNTNFCDQVEQAVPNCQKYSTKSECNICQDGYYFVTPKICAKIPEEENCLQRIKDELQCEKCKLDFKLQGGVCEPLPKYLFEFCESDNRDGKLLFTEYICNNCEQDYYPSDFNDNFICLNDDFIGRDLLTNCKYYKQIDDNFQCFMCQDGFVLENDRCIEECTDGNTLVYYTIQTNQLISVFAMPDDKYVKLLKQKKCEPNPDKNCLVKYFDVFDKNRNVCTSCPLLLQPVIEDNQYTNFIEKQGGTYYGQEMFNFVFNFGVSCVNMQNEIFHEVINCEVYTQLPDDSFACFKCKFGYNPKIPNNDYIITQCDLMDVACVIDEYILGIDNYKQEFYNNKAPLSSYFTCHKCKDSQKIPFAFITEKHISDLGTEALPRLQYAKNPLTNYDYSVECLPINFDVLEVPENKWKFMDISISYSPLQYQRCALAMINVNYRQDASQSDLKAPNKQQAGVYCVACKPKYAKVLNDNFSTGFPFMIYKCIEIENCFDSSWYNSCSLCNAGYVWEYDQQNKQINFAKCVENKIENCILMSGDICKLCQKGYRLNRDLGQCEKVIAPFCEENQMTPFTQYQILEGSSNYSEILQVIPENPGCNKCQPKYSLVLIETSTHVCSYNSFWSAKKNFDNDIYLENCDKITYSIDQKIECRQCAKDYIMTEDKKCVQQDQYPNCKIADPNNCSICRDNFYIDGGLCVQGQISFCKIYQNKDSCSQCQDGYYVIDGLCKKGDILNCLVYRNQKECLQCTIGFMIVTVSGEKSACYPLEINRNCEKYDVLNYKKNKLTCLKCLQGFAESTQGDFHKSTCIQTNIIANCLVYHTQILFTQSTLLCTQCEDQFYVDIKGNCTLRTYRVPECISYEISKDECLQCQEGYFLTPDKKCKGNPKGINNCEKYLNQFECEQCIPFHYLDQNTCFTVQAEKVIANCLYYGNIDKCIKCQERHYYLDGGCIKGSIDKCLAYDDESNCNSCEEGYGIIKNDDGKKICFVINLQNCEIPDSSNVKNCQKCEQNFYLLNGICEPIKTNIDNCVLYVSPESCGQCRPGFMLSLDFKSCSVGSGIYVVEPDCDNTIELNNMICSGCKKGHFMKELICEPCTNFSLEKGCMFCDKDDSKCLMCEKGFYMNSEGLCQEWVEEVIPEPEPEQPVEQVEYSIIYKILFFFFILYIQYQIISQIKFLFQKFKLFKKINPYNKKQQ